jgi:phosphoglycolate phosphatase
MCTFGDVHRRLQDAATLWKHASDSYFSPDDFRLAVQPCIHVQVVKLMLRALPETHQDEATVQACVGAYVQEYERTWNALTEPYPGVPEMIDALIVRGLKLAVLSNKPDHFTQRCVDELLAKWAFDVVLGASDQFPRKPDPASAIESARRLGVAPAECLYVRDSGVDMQTARAAGMFAVEALWGFRDKEELQKDGAQLLIYEPSEVG